MVNVIGNRVTVAIISLGAVVGGYVAGNDALLVTSLVLVAMGIYPAVTTALEHYFPASTAVTSRWWFGVLTGVVVAFLLVVAIGLWVVE